jgi:hypothetical protein
MPIAPKMLKSLKRLAALNRKRPALERGVPDAVLGTLVFRLPFDIRLFMTPAALSLHLSAPSWSRCLPFSRDPLRTGSEST